MSSHVHLRLVIQGFRSLLGLWKDFSSLGFCRIYIQSWVPFKSPSGSFADGSTRTGRERTLAWWWRALTLPPGRSLGPQAVLLLLWKWKKFYTNLPRFYSLPSGFFGGNMWEAYYEAFYMEAHLYCSHLLANDRYTDDGLAFGSRCFIWHLPVYGFICRCFLLWPFLLENLTLVLLRCTGN